MFQRRTRLPKRCRPSLETLEPRQLLAAQVYEGPLTGKVVYTSGGHGWQWNTTLNRYATDRGEAVVSGVGTEMVEDFGNQDQMTFYAEYLLRAGATVVPMRPVGNQTNEIVLDNDSAGVTFTGSWANSTSTHRYDEDYGATADAVAYRTATSTTGAESAVGTYQPTFAEAGFYPVYTWALSGSNRTTQLYRVNHTGGSTEIRVDHRMVGKGWVYLGTYYFNAGSSASGNVQISNNSPVSGTVIADAIRFGNGMGDFADSGAPGISGYSREDENSYKWLRRSVGTGVTATSIIGTSNVSAPSEMAEWMHSGAFGTAVYIGFHSNAAGGRGAVGLIDSDQGTPNQASLALYTGRQINQDMQALNGTFEHDWSTRTTHTYTSGFGEIDLGSGAEMDATIIEVAFHDQAEDAQLMRDPKVRDQLARSTYEATLEYFDNFGGLTAPVSQPNEPTNVRTSTNAAGDVTITWTAPTSRSGGPAAATGYRVYLSRDGYGFSNPITVAAGTSVVIPAAQLDGNAYYFKVAGTNAGGEGPGSTVVGARKQPGGGTSKVLIVNGFDRNERSQNVRYPYAYTSDGLVDRVRTRYNNSFDYVAQAGEAIEAYAGGMGFDTAQNENVNAALLANYQAVIWLSGEESTADETFNAAEQTAVSAYISAGGRLFVSGAEIGWDLDRASGPSAADRAFYNNTLKADYVNDDSGTYNVAAVAGSIFAGLSTISYNSGTDGPLYLAEYADVLTPTPGSGGIAALNYSGGTGGAAAIQWADPSSTARVVNMGFPFELITTAANRNAVMARVLDFFQPTASATPGTPDLVAATDTGMSSTDNLTNRDNSTAGKTLQFSVSGTVAGATVSLYLNGTTLIGTAVASGTTTTVTTNGTVDLADGTRGITAKQTETGKLESAASGNLNIVIDTAAPTASVVAVAPDPRTIGVNSMTVGFTEAVTGFDLADLSLTHRGGSNLLTAANAPVAGVGVTYTIPDLLALTSISGNYALVLTAAGSAIADHAGNALNSSASDTWTHALPTWLTASDSVAEWNSQTKALAITGAATITADPGVADAPLVTANGAAAVLNIAPAAGTVVNLSSLTLASSASATVDSTGASRTLAVVGTFDVTSGATLDLGDNAMVLRTATLAAVKGLITQGFNGGDWTGAGVKSSSAATDANGLTALGYLSNADLGATEFAGVTGLTGNEILVKYTYYGDADLSGAVTLDDYSQFLFGFQNPVAASWSVGDFDYSGSVTLDDYSVFLLVFQNQSGPL